MPQGDGAQGKENPDSALPGIAPIDSPRFRIYSDASYLGTPGDRGLPPLCHGRARNAWPQGALLALANHHLLYAKLDHSPGAEIAGHEGGVERSIMIAAGEAGKTQAVHFGVHELILVLHLAGFCPFRLSRPSPQVWHRWELSL